jgi:hypothetical protein
VLPKVKEVKNWQLKAVFLSDVINSLNTKLGDKPLKAYKDFCESHTRFNKARDTFQDATRVLAPLTLTNASNKYQVIDGRHRITALSTEYPWQEYTRAPGKGQRSKMHKGVFTPVYVWVICPKEEIKRG